MTLVPTDSPLRLVPSSLERRSILFFDGIRYSLHIFDLAAMRLALTLDGLSSGKFAQDDLAQHFAEGISDAWLMIDSIHRLRELLLQTPGLKKKILELQIFLRRTSAVESLRHFNQHFRTEIDSFTKLGMPLWGTLSWAYTNPESGELENHTIAPGTFFSGAGVASCTFDTMQGKFLEKVLLHAGPAKLDLAELSLHVKEFVVWYTLWFQQQFPDIDHHGADLHLQFSLKPAL